MPVYLAAAAIFITSLLLSPPGTADSAAAVDKLYQSYCATCHGQKLTGGLGSSLIDKVWKHGQSDEQIAGNIKRGIPKVGMPAWNKMLSDEQIRSLVIFIREQEASASEQAILGRAGPDQGAFTTRHHSFRLEKVGDGTGVLWGMEFLPDGDLLVTQRDGTLWRFQDGKRFGPVAGIPKVHHSGQGGLLDVQRHPAYPSNGWIYLSYSSADPKGNMTRVVRGRIKNDRWIDEQTVFAVPEQFLMTSEYHYGSRFAFRDGYLYFSIGDRGSQDMAQDLSRPNGKIHRIHDDGRIPKDNPFVSRKDAFPSIWSYGHRNPQGLALDPRNGDLWASEHGPRGGDEINLIEKGKNYGWPVITYGMNYDGTPMTAKTHQEGMEQPRHYWVPSIAVAGIEFYTGDAFSSWRNHLLVASLAREELRRLVFDKGVIVEDELLMKNQGRIRDLATGPDGSIYVLLNASVEPHTGAVFRLVPSKVEKTSARPAPAPAPAPAN